MSILYLNGSAYDAYARTIIEGLFIGNNSAANRFGSHAIVLDTQAAGGTFGRFEMRHCYLQQASAGAGHYGLFHINSAGANVNGGLYACTIEKNYISGISLNSSGDSIWIKNNTLAGSNEGVYANLIADAGNLVISENNTSAAKAAVIIDRAVTWEIINNEFEQVVTNTGANNTLVDLRGSTATLGPGRFSGNMVQDIGSTGNPTLIRVGAVTGATLDNNRFATSTARVGVSITASATDTRYGAGNTLHDATISNAGVNTMFVRGATAQDAWTAYTPTLTAGSGSFTSASATGAYQRVGKDVHVRVDVLITTVGTAATSLIFTLPVAPKSLTEMIIPGRRVTDGATYSARVTSALGTSGTATRFDGVFGISSGERIVFTGTYEAA